MDRKNKAFTLAEVLVTLAVIGIVAAMVIPNIVENYQKKAYATRLKENYSLIQQAMNFYMAEKNCVGNIDCEGIYVANDPGHLNVYNTFKPYMKIAKDCGNVNPEECFSDATGLNSSDVIPPKDSGPTAILMNGSSIRFSSTNNHGCAYISSAGVAELCGRFFVDVNGLSPPNKWGRDVFGLQVVKSGRLLPEARSAATVAQCYNATWAGIGGIDCSHRIMNESWQMTY